jgi:Putative transposase
VKDLFARPAVSNDRLSINRQGNVVLTLKTPWGNGTTHSMLTPMEFMQRLAALVPQPRLHLIRFHGVLAPNAKLKSKVVPVPPRPTNKGEGDWIVVLAIAHMRQRLQALGADAVGYMPDETARWLRDEVAMWAAVVKASGATV